MVKQTSFVYIGAIQAGFPSPAQDHLEEVLDLIELVVDNPDATYFARAMGSSMKDAGIENGDLLIVDRSLTPKNDDTVIGILCGEFFVKTLQYDHKDIWLSPANTDYPVFKMKDGQELLIWGVVTWVFKRKRSRK